MEMNEKFFCDKDITVDIDDWRLNCRAAGIIIHNNKVLLHHNTQDTYYALLGGRVKFGENSADAVRREIREELGKEIEITGYISTIENFFEIKGKKYHEIMFVHKVEFVNDDDKKIEYTLENIEGNTEKDIQYEWISLDDLGSTCIKPVMIKQILQDKVFPVHKINNDFNKNGNFEKIYNDKLIRDIYDKINKRENENENAWAHHDFNHVKNVIKMMEQILVVLGYQDKTLFEEAKISAILHDIGALEGKENHAERSYEFAKKYFAENNINLENKELVLNAIRNHSSGFDTDNIIQLALILADKLDITYTRPTKSGLNVAGMRQMQYIEDIFIDMDKANISIKFICNENLDKTELEEYYFMRKVGNAIKSFANKFNFKYKVNLNELEWNEIF